MMAEITTTCPGCGQKIRHSCDDPLLRKLAQISANGDATHESAHVFEVQVPQTATTKELGYEQGFLRFWKVYPLRRDKRRAQIAWRKALRRIAQTGASRIDAEATIIAGAKRYREDPNRDDSYTKYAEGWLNGDGWEDEPLPLRGQGRMSFTQRLLRKEGLDG